MDRQLRLATQSYASRFCALASLPGPRSDKFAFELGKSAQNGQHQTTMRSRGVSPRIRKRFEANALLGDRPQQIEEIPRGSSQSIKPGDD
jgi:hypothetical protein